VSAEIVPLGTRLRQRREQLGLTQAQAARELEVARTAYRLWEMEAARPSPDRWRAIAKWLGLSVTAMLRAAELIDEQETLDAEQARLDAENWAEGPDATDGDFFAQARTRIDAQARAGGITSAEAAGLRRVIARLQDVTEATTVPSWHPGDFRRRYPTSHLVPTLARAALAATAVGLPKAALDDASLLTSELVTNAVTHTSSGWVDVAITLTTDRLHVRVSDADTQSLRPRSPGPDGGWGLRLLAELSTRWGVERGDSGKAIWFELDLDRYLDR
jgi:transcriptional regulator with XRE-family HTH domain